MKKSVLLTAVVTLFWLNVAQANQARVPLDFRSENGSGISVNHENAGTMEVIGMDGVFVLVAKPPNYSGEKDLGEYKLEKKNINKGVQLDESKLNGRKFYHGTRKNGRLVVKNGRWHKAPEMSLNHYSQSGRGSAVQYMGEMLSHHFVGRMNPNLETQRKLKPLNLEEDEVTSDQENGLQDGIGIWKKRKHEAMLKLSKRTRARIETRRIMRWSCLRQGRCRDEDKVMPKMSHHGVHVNKTAVGDWVIIYEDVELSNKFGRSMDASQLLRCQKGQPPEINLPINSQLTLDTRGANLDQNTECNWRLKVLDGRGLMVHCYLQHDEGGHSDTSSALTLIPSADEKGQVEIERLNPRVPRGVWYFRSKEVMITFTAGSGWTEGSTYYKCDVLVK